MRTTAMMACEVEPAVPWSREAMSRAERLISPFGTGNTSVVELLNVSAAWTTFFDGAVETTPVPRLRSIRRRGVTPPYPRSARFGGMTEGSIILFPNGFVLEPKDRRHPCVNVSESSVQAASFYRDAFEVAVGGRERLLVRTELVDRIDSIFQAYFWNPVP